MPYSRIIFTGTVSTYNSFCTRENFGLNVCYICFLLDIYMWPSRNQQACTASGTIPLGFPTAWYKRTDKIVATQNIWVSKQITVVFMHLHEKTRLSDVTSKFVCLPPVADEQQSFRNMRIVHNVICIISIKQLHIFKSSLSFDVFTDLWVHFYVHLIIYIVSLRESLTQGPYVRSLLSSIFNKQYTNTVLITCANEWIYSLYSTNIAPTCGHTTNASPSTRLRRLLLVLCSQTLTIVNEIYKACYH